MKELQEIFRELARMSPDDKAVLATVADVVGSGYRRPGARMLMTRSGETFGTVSGGGLEADVLERAKKVLRTGKPEVFTYDTTQNENSIFSLNMGCRGVIRILLEPVSNESNLIKIFRFSGENRIRQVAGTLISADAANEIEIGGRLFFSRNEQFHSDKLPDFLVNLQQLRDDCLRMSNEDNLSRLQTYEIEQGSFEFFLNSSNRRFT